MTRSVLNSASFADNSVTTAKIADNAVTHKKSFSEELKPVWHNLQYQASGTSGYRFMDNYCTRINSNNGNNGPAAIAMLEGSTGTGRFQIEFIPGYSWGWSGLYLTDRNGLNIDATTGEFVTSGWWVQQPPGYKQIWMANNSSNNVRYTTLWDGSSAGSGNLISSPSGGTNTNTWYIWRNANGLVRVSDSVATTTIIASGDTTDWVVSSATAQSPSSCQIVMAKRVYGL
jgi:hypothetical protein